MEVLILHCCNKKANIIAIHCSGAKDKWAAAMSGALIVFGVLPKKISLSEKSSRNNALSFTMTWII